MISTSKMNVNSGFSPNTISNKGIICNRNWHLYKTIFSLINKLENLKRDIVLTILFCIRVLHISSAKKINFRNSLKFDQMSVCKIPYIKD